MYECVRLFLDAYAMRRWSRILHMYVFSRHHKQTGKKKLAGHVRTYVDETSLKCRFNIHRCFSERIWHVNCLHAKPVNYASPPILINIHFLFLLLAWLLHISTTLLTINKCSWIVFLRFTYNICVCGVGINCHLRRCV